MKQKITLGGSISVLIGVVIAILALLRGPIQTVLLLAAFALWGLWLMLALLRPAWRTNRAYRAQEERAAKQREALSGVNLAGLLLCHVNYRVSDYLKSAYPNASWEWTMDNPTLFIARGGTGRIRVYGVPDYEYADVTLDQKGSLSCSLVQIVPVQGGAPNQPPQNPQVWYELEGRDVLDGLIADLRSRGHSGLTVNGDGSITFQPVGGADVTTKHCFRSLPDKAHWPQLADVLRLDGLSADVLADGIAVSW